MLPHDLVRLACLSVGIDADQAQAAASAFSRMAAAQHLSGPDDLATSMAQQLRRAVDFTRPPGRRMTATEVCRLIGIAAPTRAEQSAMGRALAQVTGRKPAKSNGRHVYTMPQA